MVRMLLRQQPALGPDYAMNWQGGVASDGTYGMTFRYLFLVAVIAFRVALENSVMSDDRLMRF